MSTIIGGRCLRRAAQVLCAGAPEDGVRARRYVIIYSSNSSNSNNNNDNDSNNSNNTSNNNSSNSNSTSNNDTYM